MVNQTEKTVYAPWNWKLQYHVGRRPQLDSRLQPPFTFPLDLIRDFKLLAGKRSLARSEHRWKNGVKRIFKKTREDVRWQKPHWRGLPNTVIMNFQFPQNAAKYIYKLGEY
jgi:hypothetical protein